MSREIKFRVWDQSANRFRDWETEVKHAVVDMKAIQGEHPDFPDWISFWGMVLVPIVSRLSNYPLFKP